ncbi:hypothetical protein GBV73_09985 [Thermococcus sp. 101 C5]|uniref:hypothetical protein n=1 Tax=Thermococcus sp. 101 C5 TaxID=2654197 RepID=UPI00128C2401|nr:hypothetical protein [Thermococcus sp. 101 C5]
MLRNESDYILFYELFKKLNPGVDIVDVRGLSMELRMIKDEWELENIRKAGKIAVKGMKIAEEEIRAKSLRFSNSKGTCRAIQGC